jgi:hypothetical protein
MKRSGVAIAASVIAAWWWMHPRAQVDVARSERVLVDLAGYGGTLRWRTIEDGGGGAHGIGFQTLQAAPATIELARGRATIETATWRVEIDLARVHEVVCERRFVHYPPPGTVLLDLSFRAGREDDNLFTVAFDEAGEDDFRALCERHGLRRVGDW